MTSVITQRDLRLNGEEEVLKDGFTEPSEELDPAIEHTLQVAWEACAKSYGHTCETEIWAKYQEWRDTKMVV